MSNDDMFDEPTAEELEAMGRLLRDPALWAEPSPQVEERVLAAIQAESQGWEPPTVVSQPSTPEPVSPIASDEPTSEAQGPPTAPVSDAPERPPEPGHLNPPSTTAARIASTTGPRFSEAADVAPPTSLESRRRRRFLPLAAAAALIVVILGAVTALNLTSSSDAPPAGEVVALAGTEFAPDASALAYVDDRPNGTRIILELNDLDPAPPGFVYAVWMVRPEPRNRVAAGTFHLRAGGPAQIEFWAGVSPEEYPKVTVTVERESASDEPGQLLLAGDLGS